MGKPHKDVFVRRVPSVTENLIFRVISEWTEKNINGKKFNEVFQLDGIPVWYFFEPLIKGAYLPRPFRTLAEIKEDVESRKIPKKFDLKSKLIEFYLRKGLWLSEKIKWSISSRPVQRGERDVLFLCYTNQVVEDEKGKPRPIGFSDVIRDLGVRGVKPIVLFCDPLSKNSFKGLLKFPSLLYSYITPEMIKESNRISRELNKKWKKIDEKEKAKLFTFGRKCYWRFLKDELNFLFSREMLNVVVTYYLTFKAIVKRHDIKVICVASLGGFYETLLLGVAYALNKKVVYSPHGYGDRYFIVRDEFLKNVYFAAWGWETKKRLLNLGIKKENISITGSPFFDKIAKYKSKREKHKTGKIITLITQPLVEDGYVGKREYFKYVQKFLAQIVKIKNVAQIIIKLHPREKYRSNYESIVKSLGLKNVIITQEPGKEALYTVLSKSDLVVSTGSTADIEGIMLDKNVIVIDGLAKGFLAELSKKDKYREAVYEVNKNDDLTDAVTKILTSRDLQERLRQERRRYLAGSFYKIDGKAHERVSALILRLIKREKE